MTRSLRSAWLRRRTAVLLATATVAASFGWALAPGPSSSAQTADPPFTVEVSQTSGLLDGDIVEVTVRANPGHRIETDARERACSSAGPASTYTSAADLTRPSATVPSTPSVSTSSEGSANGCTPWPTDREQKGTSPPASGSPSGARVRASQRHARVRPGAPCLLVVRVPASVGRWPGDRPFRHPGAHVRDARSDCRVRKQEPGGGVDGGVGPDAGSVGALDAGAVRLRGVNGCVDILRPEGRRRGTRRLCQRRPGPGVHAPRDIGRSAGLDPPSNGPAVYTPVALNAVVIAAMGGQIVNDDPQWPVGVAEAVQPSRSR